ncbi:ribosome biogenesis factor YjgA [Thalassotalea litorea]|uniref:ribosome biogenesis factor YjgA n=1 Tax=Thalassotalea litorea TaxID=2020715 RepID=UPI0037362BB4
MSKHKDIDEQPDEEIIYVSKSELKRDMRELQEFSIKLAKLSVKQRNMLPLNEEIMEALALADRIRNKHDAFHRNIQFIAKQLHGDNEEEVKLAYDKITNKHSQELLRVTKLEEIREQLITGDNEVIENLIAEHDGFERQRLRQLIRQAAKEVKSGKPGKSFKELYKYLSENIPV